VLGEDRAAGLGQLRGRGVDRRAPGAHHRRAVGLLGERRGDLPDLAAEPELGAANASAEPHWPAPVSVVSRFTPGLGVVVRLRHGGVGLVAAGGGDALVLEVDARRGVEQLLEVAWPGTAARAPQRVDVADRLGDLDVALGETSCSISAIGNSGARRRGRSARGCRGAAAAAAAPAGRRRRCTSGSGSRSRRAGSWSGVRHQGSSSVGPRPGPSGSDPSPPAPCRRNRGIGGA
jgi:hypothetical protein